MPWSRSSAFGPQGVMPCYEGITYHVQPNGGGILAIVT
jgi:hypothetical protein